MPLYEIKGKILDSQGNPAPGRAAMLLDRDSGILKDKVETQADGTYTLNTTDDKPSLVLLIPKPEDMSNARVYDLVIPQEKDLSTHTVGVNDIGVPGTMGFGVGICPDLPDGFIPKSQGTFDPNHSDYGNYIYIHDGSVMVWIPRFWLKWGSGTNGVPFNQCDIKRVDYFTNETEANAEGYIMHRAFIDGGKVQPGFFVDKYINTTNLEKGCLSSHYGAIPAAFHSTQRSDGGSLPIHTILGVGGYSMQRVFDACRLRGSGFFPLSRFQTVALAFLSHCQGDAAPSTDICAWKAPDGNFNYPSGTGRNSGNVQSLHSGLYMPLKLNGSGTVSKAGIADVPNRAAHNGQACGVFDLTGNLWEVNSGFFIPTTNNFGFFKENLALRDVTQFTRVEYDTYHLNNIVSATIPNHSSSHLIGWDMSVQVFDTEVAINPDTPEYRRISIGFPKAFSGTNTETTDPINMPETRGRGYYITTSTDTICMSGGGQALYYPSPWAMFLNIYHSTSTVTTAYSHVGTRTAFYIL